MKQYGTAVYQTSRYAFQRCIYRSQVSVLHQIYDYYVNELQQTGICIREEISHSEKKNSFRVQGVALQ